MSYYDYYQPEAYIPTTHVYIEKDLSINQELEKLRLKATSALLTGRRDVVVVASVSCIYGIGNPEEFGKNVMRIKVGDQTERNQLLLTLVDMLYSRNEKNFERGNFRVKGDTVDIFLAYADHAYRLFFWGDEIEAYSAGTDPSRLDPLHSSGMVSEMMVSLPHPGLISLALKPWPFSQLTSLSLVKTS